MRHTLISAALLMAGLVAPVPVGARVHEETENSFVVRQTVMVPASPQAVWDVLVRPSEWWDVGHTFSGDAANLSLLPRAGGCFCEALPAKDAPEAPPVGSVEHMRVIYAEDARALRMVGALGPMQADAVTGVLTIVLRPGEEGTRILWEYAVSGRLRTPGMAAATDAMLTGQILRLAEKLGAGKASGWVEEKSGEDDAGPEVDGEKPGRDAGAKETKDGDDSSKSKGKGSPDSGKDGRGDPGPLVSGR